MLVVVTDIETKNLAESIGMVAYFDERVSISTAPEKNRNYCCSPVSRMIFFVLTLFCPVPLSMIIWYFLTPENHFETRRILAMSPKKLQLGMATENLLL